MFWLTRVARRVWPLLAVVAVMALVCAIHYLPPRPSGATAAAQDADRGRAALRSSDLAALARHVRTLQDGLTAMRQELTSVESESALLREHATAIDAMLANDTLTQCPVFLQDETTVRALQGIIREASAPDAAARDGEDRLGTAATIARERLRQKLESLRDGLEQQFARLETQAEALRERIQAQSAEMESLRAKMNLRLNAQESGN